MGTSRSDFLFSTPSFLEGAGTVLNMAGNYYAYNRSGSPEEADLRALASDMQMVGSDLRGAITEEMEGEEILILCPR